jgi:VIT1/CCC1 family predicted Fe2+/Mn2+ transporter
MAHDALTAHARDELGLSEATPARPLQAALASAAGLAGAVTPSALALLTVLGAVAARVGGAPMGRGAVRVAFWGALAMAASAGVGRLFGTQVP